MLDILHLSLPEYLISEVAAQKVWRVEINLASQKPGEFFFHLEECKAWYMAGLELHQHVYVAVGAEVIAKHRAEQRQLADVVTPAELSDQL